MTKYLLLAILALQAADFISTVAAFRRGAHEANPLVAGLQGLLGRDGAVLAVKVAVCVLFAYGYLHGWFTDVALAISCAIYVGVVANNVRVITMARSTSTPSNQ